MNTLYTLLFIASIGSNTSNITSQTVPNLTYGDCAETLIKLKTQSNYVTIRFADCVPQSEKKE